ncbi:glycosyltransferase family 4 protein [Sphingobacterium endophyticum]|uniref:glycosyltransferase family 4 protein n=1 Tax=Sphingobacterium endophyticum TaxID=2546448 RepID=UPI0012E25904|nr:glycosyltransferase family 4 protein [Sphingobacterium endophyticum]
MKKLLIVTNVDWFLISHRLVLAIAAVKSGWNVYVACEDTGRGGEIETEGVKFINFPLSRSGTNPIEEFNLYKRFVELYKTVKPDVVHQITIKPVVYGSLAAQKVGINGIVNAISGMGYMFTAGRIGLMQKIILFLMRKGANKSNVSFIFQNNEDKNVLLNHNVLDKCNSINIIKGSGIDLQKFAFTPQHFSGRIKVLFASRMLWDKGVRELREATEYLKDKYRNKIQFILIGKADDENRTSVSADYLKSWSDGDYILWKGHVENVLDEYKNSNIVVLPSYREGLPKNLIEACAIGRPIVTTNAIGCKDCVDEGLNGYKVPIKNGLALAEAIEKLINNPDDMVEMGKEARIKAENEFDINHVINNHLRIYNSLL